MSSKPQGSPWFPAFFVLEIPHPWKQVAHRMQVLDVQEDAEFLTQGVSEERVHEIMRQAMAKTQGRVKDSGWLVVGWLVG